MLLQSSTRTPTTSPMKNVTTPSSVSYVNSNIVWLISIFNNISFNWIFIALTNNSVLGFISYFPKKNYRGILLFIAPYQDTRKALLYKWTSCGFGEIFAPKTRARSSWSSRYATGANLQIFLYFFRTEFQHQFQSPHWWGVGCYYSQLSHISRHYSLRTISLHSQKTRSSDQVSNIWEFYTRIYTWIDILLGGCIGHQKFDLRMETNG